MTTATLRPNATLYGSFSSVSVHADTSDDTDGTYAYPVIPTSGGGAGVDLTTTTIPTGAVVKSLTCRHRIQWDGTGGWGSVLFKSFLNSGGSAYADVSTTVSGTTVTSGSGTPVATVGGLAQSVVDGLFIQAQATQTNGGTITAGTSTRMVELYADVVYVTIPVVAVDAVTPDPYTASNIIPISWVNTLDSDGGTQTRYELKVFDETTWGVSYTGLDPDTDTPYWESGEVVSGSTSASTGVLETGDGYRAYVRVAQTVNGASHWSDWDFDEFDVSVATADVDTVTAVASDSLAKITVTVARDALTEAWDFVEVQRLSGADWLPVRGATYVDATGNANSFVVVDYESGNGETVRYRARATRILSGLPITGSWVSSGVDVDWSSTDCWLKSPAYPALNQTVPIRVRPAINRSRVFGSFPVIGASFPVVVSGSMSAGQGRLEILQSVSDSSLVPLLSEPVVLLHPPADWNIGARYLAVTAVTYTPGEFSPDTRAFWAAEVVDVDTPADPDASSP